ncbi:MAG: outer membrane lipoprotein-sorting protein [Verrucomicrobiota bacterium]
MQPTKDSDVHGVLKINLPKGREEIPVVCRVFVKENSWKTVYETSATPKRGPEKLIIIRSPDAPNQYLYAKARSPQDSLPEPQPVSAAKADVPFAGSDFWLSELGLGFLDWPQQTKLKGEMRLGQPCYVLESVNTNAAQVVRVKSWIEKESGSPLIAEGYDRHHKLIKEFSLGGSSVKKVNGQWQLKKMTIRSPREKSETVLEFDLSEEK